MNEWQAAITCKAYTFLRVELMLWTSPILTACTVYFHSISLYAGQQRSENQLSALSISRLADSCLKGMHTPLD